MVGDFLQQLDGFLTWLEKYHGTCCIWKWNVCLLIRNKYFIYSILFPIFLSNHRLKTVFSTYVGKIRYTHGYHLHHLSETVFASVIFETNQCFGYSLNIENGVIGYRVLKHNYFPKVSIWWFFGFWNAYTSACDISLLESIFLRGMGICNVDKPSISRMLLHASRIRYEYLHSSIV